MLTIDTNWKRFLEKGDEPSFSFIYNTHADDLYAYGISLGFQKETCKDAIQDTFYKLYISKDNLKHVENVTAYIFKHFKYRFSGDSTFYHIAVSHADNTIKNHYRPNYSTWHVIDYSKTDGSVRHRNTHQGYADESSWSRGQSWGVYGYVLCYRKTKNPAYLAQAEKALDFIATHPNYPEDGIPYWDFDAPDIPNTYRDTSAASILASALYEISTYSDKKNYKEWADKIMASLSGPDYRAETGENGFFILMHAVGSLPHNLEVDVPLNYGDYYFLEALKRKRDLEI